MQIPISIFILPYEIDELENTLVQLKRNYLNTTTTNQYIVDVTMGISDELVDWEKSSIPLKYFTEKFNRLQSYVDWGTPNFKISKNIKGCVSQRRNTLKLYPNADCFIWLDTDITFNLFTLPIIDSAISTISSQYQYFIITPEMVRRDHPSWDILVNQDFLNTPLNYYLSNDPYQDTKLKGEVVIEEMNECKIAGGYLPCISGELLRKIGIPDDLGHYGFEDTYIMNICGKLSNIDNLNIKQFRLKNLIVGENYKYKDHSYYTNNMVLFDRREEYLSKSSKFMGQIFPTFKAPGFFIKNNYTYRLEVPDFDDTPNKDEWQKEVYEYAEYIFKSNNLTSVLDIGTGSGYKLIKHFNSVKTLGIELPATVEFLKNKYPHKTWTDKFTPVTGYDLIITSDVIEHLKNPDELLDLIKECKPKFIIISTPERDIMHGVEHYGPPSNPHHFREWNKSEFSNYIQNQGFKIIDHFISNPYTATQVILCKYNAK